MQQKNNLRSSNIELLRIFCGLGIIILHYNNVEIGKAFTFAEGNELKMLILFFLESLAIVGVNEFILISGYFLSMRQERSFWQPIKLIIQVILINLIFTIVSQLINNSFSIKPLLGCFIPNNYFVILYCILYIVSPYINLIIMKLSNIGLKRLVLILVLLFGLYPAFVDLLGEIIGQEIIGLSSIGMYGSQYGYQIVNFSMMYVIGSAIRRGIFDKLENRLIIVCLCISIITMILWNTTARLANFRRLGAWDYNNPLVIINAALTFLLFNRIEIKSSFASKNINQLAKGVFTVFLVHGYFLRFLQIERFVRGNILLLLLHIFISPVILYLIGYIIFVVYDKASSLVFKPISKKYSLLIDYRITD